MLRGQTLALIKAKGYDLLPEDDQRPWPQKIVKATKSGDMFTLKLLNGASARDKIDILNYLQTLKDSRQNYVVNVTEFISPDSLSSLEDHIIVMPWQLLLEIFLKRHPNTAGLLWTQFLEGIWFLHKHFVAHLNLKPGNILVGHEDTPLEAQLSIIDFSMSIHVQSEESMVKGYCGTPTWTALEVGMPHGLIKTYSVIQADWWSCRKMLHYFTKFRPTGSASFNEAHDQLLHSVASRRPPLSEILEMCYVHVQRHLLIGYDYMGKRQLVMDLFLSQHEYHMYDTMT